MLDAQCIVPLREADTGSIAYQLTVKIARNGECEGAQQQQLPGRRLQQILAPHYLGDAHGDVIDCNRELIRWNAVTPPDEKIAEIAACYGALLAEIQVDKTYFFAVRNAKPPVHSRGPEEASRVAAAAATSGINRLVVQIVGSAGGLGQVFARAGTWINESSGAQAPPGFQVMSAPLALRIRTIVSAAIRPLVPAKSEPLQVFNHRLRKFGARSLGIEIFVAQDQSAAELDGALGGDPKGARMAKVEKTGRRRGQTTAIR